MPLTADAIKKRLRHVQENFLSRTKCPITDDELRTFLVERIEHEKRHALFDGLDAFTAGDYATAIEVLNGNSNNEEAPGPIAEGAPAGETGGGDALRAEPNASSASVQDVVLPRRKRGRNIKTDGSSAGSVEGLDDRQ